MIILIIYYYIYVKQGFYIIDIIDIIDFQPFFLRVSLKKGPNFSIKIPTPEL